MQAPFTSYYSIYQMRQSFMAASGRNDVWADDFNYLDTPASMYFRIFFHFNTGHGLLNVGDGFINHDPIGDKSISNTNTALNYLHNNCEFQREEMLEDFVKLLSNINMKSPWYFQSIEGIGEALQRGEYHGEFTLDEELKSITIKTLPDAFDNRIATLLDLYKAICYSKNLHKEILPANLRRFDMSLYIINTPIARVHIDREKTAGGWNTDGNYNADFGIPQFSELQGQRDKVYSSAKVIEFQGCEIDPDSASTGYGEVKSDEPFSMTHDIKISFRNVVEQRYNESLNRIIGDYIFNDMDRIMREDSSNIWKDNVPDNEAPGNLRPVTASSWLGPVHSSTEKTKTALDNIKEKYSPGTLLTNMGSAVVNSTMNFAESKARQLIMGNLYYGSLTNLEANLDPVKLAGNLTTQALGRAETTVRGLAGGALRSGAGWITSRISNSQVGQNLFK